MKQKLIKGKDYDGWVWKWNVWPSGRPGTVGETAYTFRTCRQDVLKNYQPIWKRRGYRRGARLVRVKLVEVKI